ncbi:ribbon-helix-helix domain-containing protein [Limnoglobus roseus]|uniref:ribbon-helix-helix domain-containing protein n=1 Tax=Limnoglobus roseus TaxID=2598579 RepID=UPI0011EA8F15|nr:CopG family transcriptional regulator [Limnoglobus roseus]
MAKGKSKKGNESSGERFGLRVDAEWLDRVNRQADRMGLSASAYIRMATTKQLEQDEANQPVQNQKK